jgi:glycosyltransferase involved in cell wall biosynthesis
MKVAIITTRHGAQDDRIFYKQALSLAKRLDVTLIAPDDGEALNWPASIDFCPIRRRVGVFGRLLSIFEATRKVRRGNPDFCHLHDLDLALAIPLIRILTRSKIIYDSHEVFTRDDLILNGRFNSRAGRLIAALVERIEKRLVSLAHHVVTAVDTNGHAYGGIGTPLTAIFNFPPVSVFETDADALESESKKYCDCLPIVYQGSMSENRGLFHMLDAVSLAKEQEPRLLLRLIGTMDDDLRATTEARIEELGLAGNVEIEGWLPHNEIALALKTSLIGLVPLQPNEKFNRSLPIKLLEYMACGIPVVAAQLPLIAAYVDDSGAGVLYDSTRPGELAQCVLDLLADPERAQEMGVNGRRAVRDRWNWERMEEILFSVYDSLSRCPG